MKLLLQGKAMLALLQDSQHKMLPISRSSPCPEDNYDRAIERQVTHAFVWARAIAVKYLELYARCRLPASKVSKMKQD